MPRRAPWCRSLVTTDPAILCMSDVMRATCMRARLRRWTWFRSSLGGSMESSYDKTHN